MNTMLDWAEAAAQENLRAHIKGTDDIAKEAQITLAVLLTGAGAALGYMIRVVDVGTNVPVNVSLLVLTVYLFALCGALVFKVMAIDDLEVPGNEPDHIYRPGVELQLAREQELQSIQRRIKRAIARNDRTAKALNRVRRWAVFSPLVWAVSWYLVARYPGALVWGPGLG